MDKFSQYPKSAQIAIIVGAGCVLFGMGKLAGLVFGFGWWELMQRTMGQAFSFLWPIALIGAGLYMVWAGKSGRLKGVSAVDWRKPFGRSVIDKRLTGVCGGAAAFLGIDATVVRVIVVILFVINPLFTAAAYILASVLVPKI